ncbi:MAG: HAD-IA family hydrolase [Sphingomonadales bacterium]|nr:HAD-IA family hydrolase [Sphingomonadales bacterium]
MANRLALFDCDGTLVDSQHTIFRCVEIAFARAGLPSPGRVAARRVVGLSLLPAMRMLAPGVHADLHIQLTEDYKAAFQKMRGDGLVDEPLFDGIVDALDALEADGWILGVATGKSDRGLDLCLRHHGLRERFVTLQTADRHPSKPHPSMAHQAMAEAGANPETTVMIGDTSFDMVMGVAAGARAIGVDWGYHPGEELLAAGASQIVSHARELREAML